MRGANRSAGGRRHWAQNTLVIAQAAASLVLLSAAAMLGRSLHNLEHQDFGFDPGGRYLVTIITMLSDSREEHWCRSFTKLRTTCGLPRRACGWLGDRRAYRWLGLAT